MKMNPMNLVVIPKITDLKYEKMGSREISLKEVNNKTQMVFNFILSNPTEK